MVPRGAKRSIMDRNDPKWSRVVQKVQNGPKRSLVIKNFHMDLRSIFLGHPVYHHIYTMYSSIYMIQLHLEFCLVPQLDIGNLTFQNGVTRDIVDPH